jgi:hypothetical protein
MRDIPPSEEPQDPPFDRQAAIVWRWILAGLAVFWIAAAGGIWAWAKGCIGC